MGRDQGRMGRAFGRLFRERQIYHRADGVVRFIKLSSRTQFALALVIGASLLWVAYASVNVVFKEQIIVSKDQERRDQEAAYRRRLQTAESSYDQVNALNYIYAREFDATITGLKSQHDALRSLVENKSNVDARIEALAEIMSESGPPGGIRKENTNRLMVDPVGREPTPRQSRISALRDEALRGIMESQIAEGIDDEVLAQMREETAELSARQVILMARLEEDMRRQVREINSILAYTNVDMSSVKQKKRTILADASTNENDGLNGQGGPFLPVELVPGSPSYFNSVARLDTILSEMLTLTMTLESIPVAHPLTKKRRFTSGFGFRYDPVRKHVRAPHYGIDFGIPINTPLHATAAGRVTHAGRKGSFGLMVEIDHGNGFKTRFAHMNKISVRRGQRVNMHDIIGRSGNTGRSTGPHLHYEIHYRGRAVDPIKFIEAGRYVFES